MPEDYYPKMPDMAESEPSSSMASGEEKQPQSSTALVPKTLVGGKELKPGDRITFKVVHLYEDEIELQPINESEKSETSPTANEEIDMMGQASSGMGMGMSGRMMEKGM